MIYFDNIEIQGFGSIIKPLNFNLKQPGLNEMRGKIGSGKTTIPSALSWCLYGNTLKNKSTVETWEHLRPDNFKGTKVTINFNKGSNHYSITRCKGFKGKIDNKKGGNNIFICTNGVFSKTKGNRELQVEIDNILGYSFDLFVNSVVFGQRMKRIIEETGPNKKKVFEEAFEVTYIQKAKDICDNNLKDINSKTTELSLKLDSAQEKYDDISERYDEALEYESSFKERHKKTLKEIKSEISEIKSEISGIQDKLSESSKTVLINYDKLIDDLTRDKEKAAKYNNLKEELEQLWVKINKKLPKKLKKVNTICSTCGNALNKKQVKEVKKGIQDKIDKVTKKYDKIDESIKSMPKYDLGDITKRLAKANQNMGKHKQVNKYIDELSETLSSKESKLSRLKDKLKEVKNERLKVRSKRLEKKLKKASNKVNKIKKLIKKHNKEKELVKWLISEPLSNTGLKMYIFNSLMSKVNHKLKQYSEILEFKVEFGIDMESKRKDFYQAITRDNQITMYEDLSGGQKQLVDTSVAFAIHDVVNSVRPTNIMFMDEPFEGLDDETVQLVGELIEHKCKSQNLFLITHKHSFSNNNTNIINFKLDSQKNTCIS